MLIFGINTTSDIWKLLNVISPAVRRVKLETILKYHECYLCQMSPTNLAIICCILLPKCKRISLNFRAFKSKRKLENTIMTQTNLSCDNSWCACGYVFCLKIKITNLKFVTVIRIGNSIICIDIWHKYHEWYFKIVVPNFTSC